MSIRSIVTVTIIAGSLAFAGTANAQFGGISFPTLTWSDDYKSSDRTKQIIVKESKE